MTIETSFVDPKELVVERGDAHALYGGCSLITDANSWYSLINHAYTRVDSSPEGQQFTTHVAGRFCTLFKLLQSTTLFSWQDNEARSNLLKEIESNFKRLHSASSFQGDATIDDEKLCNMLFTIAMIRGTSLLKDDDDYIEDCVLWSKYISKCMKYRDLDFPIRQLEKLLPPSVLSSSASTPIDPTIQSGVSTPPQSTLLQQLSTADLETLTQMLRTSLAPTVSPDLVQLGATHAYDENHRATAMLRPPELINFPFDYPPLYNHTGEINMFGTTDKEQSSLEKTASREPVVRLVLDDGVKFVKALHSPYFKWRSTAQLPILLLYIRNCFLGTEFEQGYRSFLCHPKVLASAVSVKTTWFFCSLIDFLHAHLTHMCGTEQYLKTPKQAGTYLSYLTSIYTSFTRMRFTASTEDDLVKQVVAHFFNSLSTEETQKLRENTTDFNRCRSSYTFLRGELKRTLIELLVVPLKVHATQHATQRNEADDTLGKRKRELAPPPEHGEVCKDPTKCDPCKTWVISLFRLSGYCLRCFGPGHNFYDCFYEIAMPLFRCMFCGKLNFGPFANSHTKCQEHQKSRVCACCGDSGHYGPVCKASEDKRKAYRLASRRRS